MNNNIAIIGAGKTGRGFIARLLSEAGLVFTFIDTDLELINRLRNESEFAVEFFGNKRSPQIIRDYHVVHTDDVINEAFIDNIKTVFVCVGGTNISAAGAWLGDKMRHRICKADGSGEGSGSNSECTVVLCENADKPADKFKDAFMSVLDKPAKRVANQLFGFSSSTVFCTTIEKEKGKLNILSENYPHLECDARQLKNSFPDISQFEKIKDFENLLQRKIYTYNSASALIAYMGSSKGYLSYSEAANDPEILSLLNDLYTEINKAVCLKYGYTFEDQKAFARRSLEKFCDKEIADTIERNAREPYRKLAKNERIIGPALLIEEFGGDTTALEITAAAAIMYKDPSDIEWTSIKKKKGVSGILSDICGLELDGRLAKNITALCNTISH